MKRFIIKTAFFCIPLALPVVLFVIIDPFMIFFNNKGKIKLTKDYNISYNRDFQSTELLLNNLEKMKYNSFIMGNSRSFFYDIESWENYTNGVGFHFNASSESLFGIERKLKFLISKDIKIKNALIVLDYKTLSKTNNSSGHLYIKHPLVSGESSFYFYKEMFKGFFPRPIVAYTDLFLTNERKPYMDKFGIRENVWKIDLISNQLSYFQYDSIIKNDIQRYYKDRESIFYPRDSIQIYSNAIIGSKQKKLLLNIMSIFSSQKTNYRIIINPLYNQEKINIVDLNYLNDLFGEDYVFDFSGINKFTNDCQNYYEASHYRPHVAREILEIIYE